MPTSRFVSPDLRSHTASHYLWYSYSLISRHTYHGQAFLVPQYFAASISLVPPANIVLVFLFILWIVLPAIEWSLRNAQDIRELCDDELQVWDWGGERGYDTLRQKPQREGTFPLRGGT